MTGESDGRMNKKRMFWMFLLIGVEVGGFSLGPAFQRRVKVGKAAASTGGVRHKSVSLNAEGIPRDVVIIGGGLAGLSIALELATRSKRHVTILERDDALAQSEGDDAKMGISGSMAAAGMLAPQSERLPPGPLLNLCLASRAMYPDFVSKVESIARTCSPEAARYLPQKQQQQNHKGSFPLEAWETGFRSTGGFLAPAFADDVVATWAPPEGAGLAHWLDSHQAKELEPLLHPDVVGAWWFPEDASVDAPRLTFALRAACVQSGVHFMTNTRVSALELSDGTCRGIRLEDGRMFTAESVVVANGSWMRNLLPVPIFPHKGQSFSVRMPPSSTMMLNRVLFAQDTYIVPKADGRLIVGATVEPGSFDPNVTPAGLMHCISSAMQLLPIIADLPLERTWTGLRPTTPDKAPILGKTSWNNVFLAGGYWRNGVLLAPKTAQLIADLIFDRLSQDDEILLQSFSWNRFTDPGTGNKMAVEARHAASLHPVHNRASGLGVSSSVGTELGFYSNAGDASEERRRDREALFSGDSGTDENEAFQRAATLGKQDAKSFFFGDDDDDDHNNDNGNDDDHNNDNDDDDVETAMKSSSSPNTGQQEIQSKQDDPVIGDTTNDDKDEVQPPLASMLDGYELIQNANNRQSRSDEIDAGREARMANRAEFIDNAQMTMTEQQQQQNQKTPRQQEIPTMLQSSNQDVFSVKSDPLFDLPSLYDQIKANKAQAAETLEMENVSSDNDLPDLDFRIYHVDSESNEMLMVPPYTSPIEMAELIAKEKTQQTKILERFVMNDDLDENGTSSSTEEINTDDNDDSVQSLTNAYLDGLNFSDNVDPTSAIPLQIKEQQQNDKVQVSHNDAGDVVSSNAALPVANGHSQDEGENETTYDGYQIIQQENNGETRKDELEAGRIARKANRLNAWGAVDESQLGGFIPKEEEGDKRRPKEEEEARSESGLSSLYSQIAANKAKVAETIEMEEDPDADKKQDLPFRIYHVDKETGEQRLVPPYTSPQEMAAMIAEEKEQQLRAKISEEASAANMTGNITAS